MPIFNEILLPFFQKNTFEFLLKYSRRQFNVANRIKQTPALGATTDGYYAITEWKTGDIITQPKMMNIEDWLASATDELLQARIGLNVLFTPTRWETIGERFDYLTKLLTMVTPEGTEATVAELTEAMENVQNATRDAIAATERANNAAYSIEEMIIATETLQPGNPASILRWEKVDGRYELTFGIPTTNFTTTTNTTFDGQTPAAVTIDNSTGLTRNLTFSIPVPKFSITSETITSGPIAAGIEYFDTETLNPKLNFKIPVQNIKVSTSGLLPGLPATVAMNSENALNPTVLFGVPAQKISIGNITSLGINEPATASLVQDSTSSNPDLNLLLNLGIPRSDPFHIVKIYASEAEMYLDINNPELYSGDYVMISTGQGIENVNNPENARIYVKTDSDFDFVVDMSGAIPIFEESVNMNVVNVTENSSATITGTTETPVLNLTIPAIPVFNNHVAVTTLNSDQSATAEINGPDAEKKLTLSLNIPRGAIPNFTIGTVTTGEPGTEVAVTISGTAANPVLNLTIPRGDTGRIDNAPATKSEMGSVIVGDNLAITSEGVLSADITSYEFLITLDDWIETEDIFKYIINSIPNVTAETECYVKMTSTYYNLLEDLIVESNSDGTIIFSTAQKPIGDIGGNLIVQKIKSGGVI